MVSCFKRTKKVIFASKKNLKKGTTGWDFCSKNLERFRTPTHIKIFSSHTL